MGYLDESGLARYDGLLKNWVTFKSGTVDGIDPLLNWQKTETAASVTCYPLPAAPIDPVVNFAFTETGPAEGTKGPDNPSTIAGVSSVKVTRCGKNVITYPFYPDFISSDTQNGVKWTESNGAVTVNGTADGTLYLSIKPQQNETYRQKLKAGVTYTISGCPTGGDNSTYCLIVNTHYSGVARDTGGGATITPLVDDSAWVVIVVRNGTTVNNLVFKPQIELGSAATSFELYEGTDYAVNLGGTYYGGEIDLATGLMTVTWWGHVFDGTESAYQFDAFTNNGRCIFFRNVLQAKNSTNQTCTHLPFSANFTSDTAHFYVNYNGTNTGLVMFAPYLTLSDFKSWLAEQYVAGTPVTVACELKTPYTVQLTPLQVFSLSQSDPYTPRLNTIYSDQQSVQVGYPKSPQATSTELTNAIISLGSNL